MRRLSALALLFTVPALSSAAQAVAAEYRASAQVVRAVPIVNRDVARTPVKHCTWELAPGVLDSRRYQRHSERDRYFKRCTTRYESSVRRAVEGYRVTYRYGGETFQERTPQDPGKEVPIRVRLTPVAG